MDSKTANMARRAGCVKCVFWKRMGDTTLGQCHVDKPRTSTVHWPTVLEADFCSAWLPKEDLH